MRLVSQLAELISGLERRLAGFGKTHSPGSDGVGEITQIMGGTQQSPGEGKAVRDGRHIHHAWLIRVARKSRHE